MAQERLRSIPDRRPDATASAAISSTRTISASVVVGRIDRPDAEHQAAAHRGHARRAGHRPRDSLRRQHSSSTPSGSQAEITRSRPGDRSVARSHRRRAALRQVYNEEGFLKAEIAGRPLTIDGTTGVLWFDIKEGPRAQITSLQVGRRRPSRALPEVREGGGDARRRRRTWRPTSTTRACASRSAIAARVSTTPRSRCSRRSRPTTPSR